MIISEANISETTFDVIVIGAGINGAGIARDAAMRGLQVLLLDKGDIGGGTSAWSTRLIHGGLRYLEHKELSLVRESLREREHLLNIAPHLVRPLPLLVPLYEDARRGLWTMKAGMIAYDLLSFDKTLPRHRMLSREEALQESPGLNRNGLLGAAVYYDAQVEFAERLVIENVLSALNHGTRVVTYAHVDNLVVNDDDLLGVEFSEKLTGDIHTARSRLVINAAGPWVDQVLESVERGPKRLIGGTKGSHLVVGPFTGAPSSAIYVEAQNDQRPFFIIPWNNNYLIGTTDIHYDGDLDEVTISRDEVEYLLRETNRVIPSAQLDRGSILYTYSGVRPLPYIGDKDEESITRRHFIRPHPKVNNLLSIVGGKLTTYRSLAEEAVDLIYQKLGKPSPPCTTASEKLPGADTGEFSAFAKELADQSELSELSVSHLLRTYGVAAAAVIEIAATDSRLTNVIDPETGAIGAEVVYSFKHEFAQTLCDCLLRRTMIGLNSTRGLNAIEAAADVAQNFLGWSQDRAAREIKMYKNYIDKRLSKGSSPVSSRS